MKVEEITYICERCDHEYESVGKCDCICYRCGRQMVKKTPIVVGEASKVISYNNY